MEEKKLRVILSIIGLVIFIANLLFMCTAGFLSAINTDIGKMLFPISLFVSLATNFTYWAIVAGIYMIRDGKL